MANTDKNIIITPNIGSSTGDPEILFSGADSTTGPQNIKLKVYPTDNGTLSFEGSAGQLFSITNSLSGTIFSVNDVSGIPSIEVLDSGVIKLAEYSGNVLVGTNVDDGTKLQVNGGISTPTTWINYSLSNNNQYNENIRLYPAANNVSVIAYGATGTSGTPWNSTLGYSDRFEIRQGSQWQLRSYANYVEVYGYLTAPTLKSTIATGVAPLEITSTTVVNNLNADLLDGNNASAFALASHTHSIISDITDEHRLFNNMGDNHSTRTQFDASTPSYNFGWRFVQGSTNGPGTSGSQFYSAYIGLGNDYLATGAGSYGMYLAIDRNVTNPYLSIRYNENNSLSTWRKIHAGRADGWTSSITLTIGSTGKSVDGTGNVSWSITEVIPTTTNFQVNSLGVGTAGSGTAGEIRATNNITAYYSSDQKFKENIEDIPNALKTVINIGGKFFDWKDSYIAEKGGQDGYFVQKKDFGVIAQDVEKHFPRAVRKRKDDTLAVDYEKLCALAFAAIKELNEKIEKMENSK